MGGPILISKNSQDRCQVPQDVTQLPQDGAQLPQDVTQLPQDVTQLPQDALQERPVLLCFDQSATAKMSALTVG